MPHCGVEKVVRQRTGCDRRVTLADPGEVPSDYRLADAEGRAHSGALLAEWTDDDLVAYIATSSGISMLVGRS